MVINSSHTLGSPEADGRVYVHETHTLEDGRVMTYNWLSNGTQNIDMVLEERARKIGAVLAEREAARVMVTGTEVPYTRHEFLSRFTPAERIVIRNSAKTDDNLMDFMEMLNASGGVLMSKARPGISYIESIGILTAARAAVIGAN